VTQVEALQAAFKIADWQQVVLNGGPPCFHLEHGRFCLRAQRWGGHRSGDWPYHAFVSMADQLQPFLVLLVEQQQKTEQEKP